MIPPDYRFYVPEGYVFPGGPHTWVVIDFDQRRWFEITGPASALPDEESAIKCMGRYVDQVAPEMHALTISEDEKLLDVSADETTQRGKLHVGTDLVETKGTKELVVFKYTIFQERVENIWDELHILRALNGHKSFVGFHRVVIDDISQKILGFTSLYIPGGNLEKYNQIFYFRWLKQLTDAVDDLNLRLGIMHQDVAPRNILIDPVTGDLKIFDFDRSALVGIGSPKQTRGANDVDAVIFTVYEALTKDDHYRRIPFDEQEVSKVEALEEWNLQLPLEDGVGGITAYRSFLSEWATVRRTTRSIKHYSEAMEPIVWPAYQEPGPIMIENKNGRYEAGRRRRRDAIKMGDYVTCWERPPQKKQESGSHN